jgi:hypothetical protein
MTTAEFSDADKMEKRMKISLFLLGVVMILSQIALYVSPTFAQVNVCVNSSYRMRQYVITDNQTGISHEIDLPQFCNFGCDGTSNSCRTDPFFIAVGLFIVLAFFMFLLFWIKRKK